jgi:pimeloyl-ACP methyl ester carboxylesterase
MSRASRIAGLAAQVALASGAALLVALARPRPQPPGDSAPEPPPGLPPGRLVHVPGHGELFVRDSGEAPGRPTIVLLHGWMVPSDANWFPVYGPLSAAGRVLAVDHRGHGYGPRPATPFRLADVADDVAALLRHLGTGAAVVVGYSMGGPVAQLLWQRHPELVTGLVLCATSATFSATARDRWAWRAMGVLQVVLRLLPRHWWERALRAQLHGRLPVRVSRLITEDMPDDVEQLLPWIVGLLDRGSAEDIAEAGRELGRFDARGWIGSIDVPVSVLVTTHDSLVPVRNQRDLAARIPGVRAHDLACDHNAAGAATAVFVPALLEAVDEVVRAAR